MHCVYILQSLKDRKLYIGRAKDLKERLSEHNKGRVKSTQKRRPLVLVYAEICRDIRDAVHREKYLKTAWGKRYIKNRLKNDKRLII